MDIMKNEVDHFENKLTTLTLKFNSQDRMNVIIDLLKNTY